MKLIISFLLLFLLGCAGGSYDYEASNSAPRIHTVYNPQTGDTDTFGPAGRGYINYDTGEMYGPVNQNKRPTYMNYETGEMYWPVGNYGYQNSQGEMFYVH